MEGVIILLIFHHHRWRVESSRTIIMKNKSFLIYEKKKTIPKNIFK